MEPLAAVLAGVGPGVRVDQEMRRQSRRAFEHLSTHIAAKATLLHADNHTHNQHGCRGDKSVFLPERLQRDPYLGSAIASDRSEAVWDVGSGRGCG